MRCEHGEGPSANGGGGAKTGGRVEGKGRGQDQRVREQGPGEGGGAEGERGQPPCARVIWRSQLRYLQPAVISGRQKSGGISSEVVSACVSASRR